jgi:hypothetical protein
MCVPAANVRNSGKWGTADGGTENICPPAPSAHAQKTVSSNKMLRTEVEILLEVVHVFTS